MEVKKIRQLLQRYLLGTAGTQEDNTVEQWYGSFDEETPLQLTPAEESRLGQEMWLKIQPALVPTKSIFIRRTWVRVAASLLLLAGAGLGSFLIWKQSCNNCDAIAYREVHTHNGEQKKVQLADGTLLTINAGSTVRIASNFEQHRNVQVIDGEVFFDVRKSTAQPFIVESGPVTTTVLGTSFNVAAYAKVHMLNIGILTGKVRIDTKNQPAVALEKGQALAYNRTDQSRRISALDPETLGWQQGKLILNDVSFDDMVVLMEKNFGLRITASQATVMATHYTTELDTHMDPAQAAEVLAAIHHLKIRGLKDQVLLYE